MAAKQAASIYDKSQIKVVESKTVGAGYSALSMLDYTCDDPDQIIQQMMESMQDTITGMVAQSVRDTTLNDVAVYKGQYMGFTDHVMYTCQPTKIQAALTLAENLQVKEKEFLIAVYGKGVTQEEKTAFTSALSQSYPALEVYEIEGEQDVYDLLLIIE
jgi:dihydroxyacetone kinase-like predicted kinase